MIWKVWYGVQPMYLSNAHIHAKTHTHICFEMVVDRGGCRSEEQVIYSEKFSQRRLYFKKKCTRFHLGDKCTREEDSWCFVNLWTNLSKTRSAENVRTCVVKDSWEPQGTWRRRGRWGNKGIERLWLPLSWLWYLEPHRRELKGKKQKTLQ